MKEGVICHHREVREETEMVSKLPFNVSEAYTRTPPYSNYHVSYRPLCINL
jgi:hypothetical protein